MPTNTSILVPGTKTNNNFISQIQTGLSTKYDITVANPITFHVGLNGNQSASWTGVDVLDVYIPTISDLISDPVKFVGTVGSDGIPKDDNGDTISPVKGNLVVFTSNCSSFVPGTDVEPIPCEAGDMAVYDGNKWCVIQGENQVRIVGTPSNGKVNVDITGTAKEVLTVEGTTLTLAIDYDDVRTHISYTTAAVSGSVDVSGATVTVAPTYVGLTQAADSSVALSTISIDLPTALASGAVTFTNPNVLASSDISLVEGSWRTLASNAASVEISASTNIALGLSSGSDFVHSINGAVGAVRLVDGNSTTKDITFLSGIEAGAGSKSFISNIRVKTSDDTALATAFTIPGAVSLDASHKTFVSGLGDTNAAGSNALVSDVTGAKGAITLGEGTDFVTGLSTGSEVITKVTFGSAVVDNSKQWFVTGLADNASAVTDVSFGSVVVTPSTSSAIVEASVSGHVLSFNTGSFVTSASVELSGAGVTTKNFTKSGVSLTGFSVVSSGFTKGAYSQEDVTVSYKSLLTGEAALTTASPVEYVAVAQAETVYSPQLSYKKLETDDAVITTSKYNLNNTGITAYVPANKFIVGYGSDGSWPSLSISAPSQTLEATVSTTLTSTSKSWKAINTAEDSFTIPGAYSLTSDSTAAGAIIVGAADTYSALNGYVDIDAGTFVTGVFVDDSSVNA